MGLGDTLLSDTVGVAWRAATGTVDPWTKNEIVDQAAADYQQAGMSPDQATAQAQQDVTTTLETFKLGDAAAKNIGYLGDPNFTGADPSQAKEGITQSLHAAGSIVKTGSGVILAIAAAAAIGYVLLISVQKKAISA